ncbi:MAG: MBL fold metallo-hydrolase [Acidobacteria bacterium]|jgi:ribonuclease BN (tRNA processing enzyme)|nr:MBL fold metallo-hydrolase [Acidobacteriota bacterium]HJN43158.1 MBL fold metallo-hydrolase [Vicinamibacterales bacterium]
MRRHIETLPTIACLLVLGGCVAAPSGEVPASSLEREATAAPVAQAAPPTTEPRDPSRTWIVLLGTGTPGAEPDRFGPATAIVAGGTAYLIDAGPGVVRRAAAGAIVSGLPALRPQNLRMAFFTHLHSDHTIGYPDLILSPWVLGRTAPLQAFGPPGLDAMTTALLEAYREDIRVRVEGPEQLRRDLLAVETREIEPGLIYEDPVMRVEAFAVPHGTWDQAFGFKLTTADRTIVISGDTGPFDGMADIASGADVLIHEAYGAEGLRLRDPGIQRYHGTFHTSAIKVGEIAAEAEVGMVILTHQLHLAGETPDEMVDQVRLSFDGEVVYGRDLDIF